MRKIIVAVVAFAALSLSACSTSVGTTNQDDGLCKQTHKKSFIGITYSTKESFINCNNEN